MSFENPQPGDHTPHDAPRPGDEAKLRGNEQDRAGDRAPDDRATAADQRQFDKQFKEKGTPLSSGVKAIHFSAPFIKRPVATFLLSFAILLAGAVAYKLLPVSSLPQVEFPVIGVGASLPGADPETMASAVATPLERQFSRIAGINQMTSSSTAGQTGITMQFDLDRDVNGAARDVQAAINAARAQLPANLPSNPGYRKSNPSDSPILILALTSDTATVPQMYDVSDSILAQKIAQVDGVGQTFTGGSAKPAVRIEANPNLLASTGIGLEALRAAVAGVNVLQPTGFLNGTGPDGQRWSIKTTDQLFGAAAYAPLIIATGKGAVSNAAAASGLPSASASAVNPSNPAPTTATAKPGSPATPSSTVTNFANAKIATPGPSTAQGTLRIQDVARVYDGVENVHTGGLFNGKPAILIIVFKSSGANVITTVDNVLKILPTLQASIPPNIKLQVVLDRTATIRASIRDITRTLTISVILVILVVFVFLREGRSTLIPSVSVPLSLLGTCGVMYMLGYTLDNLSLIALTIATGFVVDDAIVVIENISRHMEDGLSPFDAAMLGSKEIGFTVLSMSTSLVAVFIPILLMGGILGRLFREFAVTLSVAIGISLVVSLTATPMLAAKFLKPFKERRKGWFYAMGERHIARVTAEYARGLGWVIKHKAITLTVFLLTFALNIYLFTIVPTGFFPQQDAGRIGGRIQGQQDVSFTDMKRKLDQMVAITQKDPAVQNSLAFLGGGPGGASSNSASMFLVLKPDAERHHPFWSNARDDSVEAVMNRLRPKTSHIPGVQLYMQAVQELTIGGRGSATQYQYSLTADSVAELNEWSPKLMAAMQKLPQLKDIATDQQDKGLRAQIVIDRDTASRLGVSALAIDSTLSDAFGQRQVSTTYKPLNQYHVVLEVDEQYSDSLADLSRIYVKSTTGAEIPLSAITHYEEQRIPLAVNHQGQSPAATLSFNLAPGASLSDATAAVENARQQIGMPSTIHGGFQGTAQAYQSSLSSEPKLILLALITVYIVLGILYESFIHPLTILSTLPSAGVGALLALLMFKIELSVIAMIGMILLIGIVNKNAIMMIDFALVAEREQGKSPEQAIFQACMLRFRPIMMTTLAAMLGGIPLALGTGTGSELRRPLGVAIVGGLIVSQCLTLFTTPVVYLFFDRLRVALPRFRTRARRWAGFAPKRQPVDTPLHAAGD
ncbi:MAG: efflux RND transporter permease subunit [Acidobacteriaceae bacterium]